MTQVNLTYRVEKNLTVVAIIDSMKIRIVSLLVLPLVMIVCSAVSAWCNDPADIYHLDVRLLPASQQLEGTATLTVTAEQRVSGLLLRLSSQAEMLSVTLDGQPAEFLFSGETLQLFPAEKVLSDSSLLVVRYLVRYSDPLPELSLIHI